MEAQAHSSLAGMAITEGRLDDADAALSRASRITHEMGLPRKEAGVDAAIARLRIHQGRLEEARSAADRALEGARATQYVILEAFAYGLFAEIAIAAGDRAGAEHALFEARQAVAACGAESQRARLDTLQARLSDLPNRD